MIRSTKRFSPMRPLGGAAIFSFVMSVLYGIGYRGSCNVWVDYFDISGSVRLFILCFVVIFGFFYLLQMFGVEIAWSARSKRQKENRTAKKH